MTQYSKCPPSVLGELTEIDEFAPTGQLEHVLHSVMQSVERVAKLDERVAKIISRLYDSAPASQDKDVYDGSGMIGRITAALDSLSHELSDLEEHISNIEAL